MKIDCVRFYVEDAAKWRDWFVQVMQFCGVAGGQNLHTRTEVVKSGAIAFVLSSPLSTESPVAEYLRAHPPGVADVTFLVPDLEAVMERAIAQGTTILQPIQCKKFPQGELKWSKIVGLTPLCHTLVERRGITPILPEDWAIAIDESIIPNPYPLFARGVRGDSKIQNRIGLFAVIDHVVLNVAVGELETTVSWYERALGFERQQTFAIQTEKSGLYSQVLVHPASGLQIPVNEPISGSSQIQEFLDFNGGAGVQHIALRTNIIIRATCQLRAAGLSFLQVPQHYYVQLQQRYPQLNLSRQEWEEMARSQILIDAQEPKNGRTPLLLQIFTQPIFAQPTFFFEIIERRDRARGFGEGNFRALFEAMEKEQAKRGNLF
jgi:4-hydroxyphenylpyruvate dioxygenase